MPLKDKEKKKEYNDEYRLMNWETIRAHENKVIDCIYCNRKYTHGNKAQHFRSNIHNRIYAQSLFSQLPFCD